MKNLLVVSLFILSTVTYGQIAPGRGTRLSFEQSKILHPISVSAPKIRITVDRKGLAKAVVVDGRNSSEVYLKVFLKDEMANINHLIEGAADGDLDMPKPGQPHCLALPNTQVSYKADNGKVVLYSAAVPCGSWVRNTSTEAQELIDILKELHETLKSELDTVVLRS